MASVTPFVSGKGLIDDNSMEEKHSFQGWKIVASLTQECENDIATRKKHFWESIRPLLIPMKLFGAWPYTTVGNFDETNKWWRVYSYIVLLSNILAYCFMVGFVGFLISIGSFGNVIISIPTSAIEVQVIVNLFTMVCGKKKIIKAMKSWESFVSSEKLGCSMIIKKYCKIITAISISNILLLISLYTAYVNDISTNYIRLTTVSFSFFIVYGILAIVFIWVTGLYPLMLLMMFAYLTQNEFQQINTDFVRDGQVLRKVGMCRATHNRISRLVLHTNELFGPVTFVFCCGAFVSLLVLLYVVSNSSFLLFGQFQVCLTVLVILLCSTALMTIAVTGEKVKDKVRYNKNCELVCNTAN